MSIDQHIKIKELEKELGDSQELNNMAEIRHAELIKERDELMAESVRMRDAIDKLVAESEGVAGLHLNGDIATWDELLQPEDWLEAFISTDAGKVKK